MDKDNVDDASILDTPTTEKLVAELTQDLKNLIAKYNNDMTTLNRILSTYEDEIAGLKNQYHDLSFKYKQIVQSTSDTKKE
jgi:molybdenum-dependent DNA-binding transcriptional regulator ModE